MQWIDRLFLKEYFLKPLCFAVVIVIVLFLLNQFSYFNISLGSNNSYNSFEVIGTGKVTAIPNVATTSFTIEEKADTQEQARANANEKQTKALLALEKIGILKTDIKTVGFYVNPNYENERIQIIIDEPTEQLLPRGPVQKGYIATVTTQVKAPEVDKINQAIDTLTAIGINVGGVSFELDEENQYKMEATDLAIQDAKVQAQNMAKAAGFKLGNIITIRNADDGYGYPQPYAADAVLKSAPEQATDLQPGENEISARIGVTYQIKN